MGLGAGVPCPPSRPCAGSPLCCWDTNVRTPLEDPSAGVGGGEGGPSPSHGPQSASPAAGSWSPLCPPAKVREGWSHRHPSPAVSPEPRTGLAQTEKQGCLWGVEMGAGLREGETTRRGKSWGEERCPGPPARVAAEKAALDTPPAPQEPQESSDGLSVLRLKYLQS